MTPCFTSLIRSKINDTDLLQAKVAKSILGRFLILGMHYILSQRRCHTNGSSFSTAQYLIVYFKCNWPYLIPMKLLKNVLKSKLLIRYLHIRSMNAAHVEIKYWKRESFFYFLSLQIKRDTYSSSILGPDSGWTYIKRSLYRHHL